MASEWVTLNNGYKYNRKTGETVLEGKDSKSPLYRYDPTKNRTTYNGQEFTGRYDPYAIAAITGDDYEAAYKKYEDPYLNKEIDKLEKNPFITTQKKADEMSSPISSTYNRLSFGQAYDTARKRMEGPGFFDQIKNYDFGDNAPQGDTVNEFMASHPNLSPDIQAKINDQLKVANDFQNKTGAYGPTPAASPTAPSLPESSNQPSSPDQPDWKSLYDQLQGLFNSQKQTTSKPREQIGSFMQYGPGGGRQSYQSSAPYSGKGS